MSERDGPPTTTHQRVLLDLQQRVEAGLREHVRGDRVAFVNFPNHSNAGDPALWLGARRTLRRLGKRVVYQCEHRTYEPSALRAARPDVIAINGGGNLGDLWKGQQQVRERVLADFPEVPTVQLPQSIAFERADNLARNQRLIADHRALTLLLRDPDSLAFARDRFDAPSHLCPDLAFALGPQARAAAPRHRVLWLARQDKESTGYRVPVDELDAVVLDWLDEVPDEPAWPATARAARTLNRRLSARVAGDPAAARRWSRVLGTTHEPLARAWLARGMAILARGEVVVTDRLHGHILSLLQGIPHVVLDNSYGKVRTVHDTFTAASPLVRWADTPGRAAEIAAEIAPDLR